MTCVAPEGYINFILAIFAVFVEAIFAVFVEPPNQNDCYMHAYVYMTLLAKTRNNPARTKIQIMA